jgi:transcriptional regulator with XRE-family HTH domain
MASNLRFSKEELKKIGSRMCAARILTGMKQEEFTLKQNISHTSIKNWELGKALPRHDGIVAVLTTLKECGIFVSLEWLLYGNGPGPSYLGNYDVIPDECSHEFVDDHIKLFKKAQRAKGFNPVVITIKNKAMAPFYKEGDMLGGIVVSQEFVRIELAHNVRSKIPWLITLATGSFTPAFVYVHGDRWLINTLEDPELKECSLPSIAKIKWHYALGSEI